MAIIPKAADAPKVISVLMRTRISLQYLGKFGPEDWLEITGRALVKSRSLIFAQLEVNKH
jgi:hypothetical protein